MANIRQAAWPHYLVAAALIFFPVYEVIVNNLLPIHLHDARWRFAAFGLVSASLLIVSVGVMIAYWVSTTYDHWRFQSVLGIGALLVAVVLLGLVGLFALDALQIRSSVRAEATNAFHAASLVAATRAIVCAIAIAGLGTAALRASRVSRAADLQRMAKAAPKNSSPLVGRRAAGREGEL